MRLVAICPESVIEQNNHLVCAASGRTLADLSTFTSANYTDGTNNYCVIETQVSDVFAGAMSAAPERPAIDKPDEEGNYHIDMDLVADAHEAMTIYQAVIVDGEVQNPIADLFPLSGMLVLPRHNLQSFLSLCGLERITEETEL